MSQSTRDTIIHLVAGGAAGTAGAVVTCPLEVVKTRLQSSSSGFHSPQPQLQPHVCLPKIASPDGCSHGHVTCKTIQHRRRINTITPRHATQFLALSHYGRTAAGGLQSTAAAGAAAPTGLVQCLRHIVEHEGPRALFKGLGPNLVGVAPSRAIYFCAYSQSKTALNSVFSPDTAIVHILSASCAGLALQLETSLPSAGARARHSPSRDCASVDRQRVNAPQRHTFPFTGSATCQPTTPNP
ncbi:hypothetical protein LSTR_LSTR001553 [Laodelphax striatellus]|uniref:Uncharacterized protein n=1 Tax=Laodelphax striatellus TaxID=195883 RepID=A0A482XCA0_LAOST|nr:hypothetical protein LSTR_LSTR001553 [Laodelphax striatellus]